ncbi:MAG: zinc ABC transporter solute-binding protein [Verrucomicrobiales bacterium]|nr:zinc ABC transporter solute-binding protein [Verrucomicrobiales bacterium]
MTNFRILFSFLGASALFLSGCQSDMDPDAGAKPRIVATTTMLADMARQIAGDEAEVIGLMAPGVDPHTYELPARAIGQLNSADLVIYNGLLLEGKMEEVIEGLSSKGVEVFAAGKILPKDRLVASGEAGHGGDPHIWGDAELWAEVVDPVASAILSILPNPKEKAADLRPRQEAYKKKILDLHSWIKSRIAEVPEDQRLLVTSHDAFNYLGRAYGFEVIGIQGISTATEAGMADIVNTVDLVKERGVKAIFVESSVSSATIERVAKDAGVKIGGELFSDSCGPAGETKTAHGETYDVGTYIGMMKHNINTIVDSLK